MPGYGMLFFATENDLRKTLGCINDEFPMEFIEYEFYDSLDDIKRLTVDTIPNLGTSQYGSHVDRPMTVIRADEQIIADEVHQGDITRYTVKNIYNPGSVTMWLGGFYGTECLVEGRVDALNKTEEAQHLMKLFRKYFRRNSARKVGSHYIGQEALTYAGKVRLVTIDVTSPPGYDLKIEA
jgi:hypothetical protein